MADAGFGYALVLGELSRAVGLFLAEVPRLHRRDTLRPARGRHVIFAVHNYFGRP